MLLEHSQQDAPALADLGTSDRPAPTTLRHSISLYVPTAYAPAWRRELSGTFGGDTSYRDADGDWINPDSGELVSEPITVIQSFANDLGLMHRTARRFADDMHTRGEHTAMYSIDGVAYLA